MRFSDFQLKAYLLLFSTDEMHNSRALVDNKVDGVSHFLVAYFYEMDIETCFISF